MSTARPGPGWTFDYSRNGWIYPGTKDFVGERDSPQDRANAQIAAHGGANSAVVHRRDKGYSPANKLEYVPTSPTAAAYQAATASMPLRTQTPQDEWKRMGEYLKRMSTQRPDKWSWRS